jgi:hypothetical protein
LICHVGSLSGESAIFGRGAYCGRVSHSMSVYLDTGQNRTLAYGRLWGEAAVLEAAATMSPVRLVLDDGAELEVAIEQLVPELGYAIATSEGLPGF